MITIGAPIVIAWALLAAHPARRLQGCI